ncbi:MAG: tetratricopeptide repeat protein [Magnetococcales bacterium]|nr:tetratricopeptide repeat protein [Magnetococcales bacterium]
MNTPSQNLSIPQALALGLQHHQRGELPQAEQIYRQILTADPRHAETLHLLGVMAMQVGQLQEAERLIEQALSIQPRFSGALGNLGNVLREQGRLKEATGRFKRAIKLDPKASDLHLNLGETYRRMGQIREAISSYRRAATLNPGFSQAHNSLANLLKEQGRTKEALKHYRKATACADTPPEPHHNLGDLLLEMGKTEQAIASYQRALAIQPQLAPTHNSLGNALKKAGQLEKARDHYQTALIIQPDMIQAHNNLGTLLADMLEIEPAITSLERALELKPDYESALFNLGSLLEKQGRLDEALARFLEALKINPNATKVRNNLGNVYLGLGRLKEAMTCFQKGLETITDATDTPEMRQIAYILRRNVTMTQLYTPGTTHEALFESSRESVTHHLEENHLESAPLRPALDPHLGQRRIRVGYLSSDFHDHPVGHNLSPLLENHDREAFEIHLYAEPPRKDDDTRKMRQIAHQWHTTRDLTDQQVAEQIRKDGIDIMVYMAGLFDDNRFMIAAHRPAPLQISFHSGTTTALESMDYWITDQLLHPKGRYQERFSETLYRLPNFYAYPIPEQAPPANHLPARENGYITFISLNNPAKINGEVIHLWSRILTERPDARLILKYRNHFGTPSLRETIQRRFNARNIDAERITMLEQGGSLQEHLALYHQADIALDPFPFTGATTTFQALWMGVPVVTLPGDRFISRMTADIIHHAGLDEPLAAESLDAYLEKTLQLAGDLQTLDEMRQSLRQRLRTSPLCNGPEYARQMESAYRTMLDEIT